MSSLYYLILCSRTNLVCLFHSLFCLSAKKHFNLSPFILARVLPLPDHRAIISHLIASSSHILDLLPRFSLSYSISFYFTPSIVLHLRLSLSIAWVCSDKIYFLVFMNSFIVSALKLIIIVSSLLWNDSVSSSVNIGA
jgi:hypothetical protein